MQGSFSSPIVPRSREKGRDHRSKEEQRKQKVGSKGFTTVSTGTPRISLDLSQREGIIKGTLEFPLSE